MTTSNIESGLPWRAIARGEVYREYHHDDGTIKRVDRPTRIATTPIGHWFQTAGGETLFIPYGWVEMRTFRET